MHGRMAGKVIVSSSSCIKSSGHMDPLPCGSRIEDPRAGAGPNVEFSRPKEKKPAGCQRRRRKRLQYKGRKERLRCQNAQLKQSIQEALQAKLMLEKRESKLKREKALMIRLVVQFCVYSGLQMASTASLATMLNLMHANAGDRQT